MDRGRKLLLCGGLVSATSGKPGIKKWLALGAVAAVVALLARYFWKRRPERRT